MRPLLRLFSTLGTFGFMLGVIGTVISSIAYHKAFSIDVNPSVTCDCEYTPANVTGQNITVSSISFNNSFATNVSGYTNFTATSINVNGKYLFASYPIYSDGSTIRNCPPIVILFDVSGDFVTGTIRSFSCLNVTTTSSIGTSGKIPYFLRCYYASNPFIFQGCPQTIYQNRINETLGMGLMFTDATGEVDFTADVYNVRNFYTDLYIPSFSFSYQRTLPDLS